MTEELAKNKKANIGEKIWLEFKPGAQAWTYAEVPMILESYPLGGALVARAFRETQKIFNHTVSTLYGLVAGRITPSAMSGPAGTRPAGSGRWSPACHRCG